MRLLTSFLPEDTTLGKITTKDLNRYFEWMEKERDVPCSPKTLARRITATKSLFRWLHQYGVLAVDPAEKVAQRSAISPLPTVLTPEEYDAVLLAADRHRRDQKPDARPYTLVYLLLTTGIKKSETLGIKLEHVELDTPNGPQIFIRYASPANRYKERKLTLPDDWIPAYNEYLAQYAADRAGLPLVAAAAGVSARRHRQRSRSDEASLLRHVPLDLRAERLPRRRRTR